MKNLIPTDNPIIPSYISGRYYGPIHTATSTLALTANTVQYTYLWLPSDLAVNQLAVNCTAASGQIKLGIYTHSSGLPGQLIYGSGAIDTSVATLTQDVSLILRKGSYWTAVAVAGTPTLTVLGSTSLTAWQLGYISFAQLTRSGLQATTAFSGTLSQTADLSAQFYTQTPPLMLLRSA